MSDPIIAQAADGSSHEFPSETDPAIVDRVMKQYAMQQIVKSRMAPLAQKDSIPMDVAKSGVTGLAKGGAGLLDAASGLTAIPGDLSPALAQQKQENLANPNLTIPTTLVGGSGQDVADFIGRMVGGFHTPQTPAGDIAERAGTLAPAALVPGGLPARMARVLVPTAGGTIGKELDGPQGEFLGELAGGGTEALGEGAFNAGRSFGAARANPQDYAKSLITKAMQNDKIDPANAAQVLGRYPDKPLNVMDVGGTNTASLGRTINTLGGAPGEQMARTLSERAADQNGRVLQDISSSLANGSDVHAVGQKIIAQQKSASKPAYEAAGIPSNPEDYATAPTIDTPAIKRLLEKSSDVQAAIAQAKRLPDYADLPDTSMVLLDKAYKNIGGKADVASRAGDGTAARDLNSLRVDLKNAITGGEPNHPYQLALDAYSGPAKSLDAIESGKSFLDLAPEELKTATAKLSAPEKQLFQVGAGRALQDRINSVADNRDAVARVFGNATIRNQIEAVFGPGSATKFAESMTPENMMTGTNRFVTGGSNTMNKAADIAGTAGNVGRDAAMGFMQGGVHGAVAQPLMNIGKAKIEAFFNRMTPEVRQAMADILTQTGPSGASNLSARNLAPLTINNRAGANIPAISAAALARLLQQPQNTAN